MLSATAIVRSGDLFWLKPVAIVVYMLCSACRVVAFEAVLCGDVWDIFVMYGSSVFFSGFAIPGEVRLVCNSV